MCSKSENNAQKRVSNFTQAEEDYLIGLVKKHSLVIESKVTNAVMNNQKIDAWNTLTEEFNSVFTNTYRDMKSLRTKFNNLKKNTKKKFADEKCYRRGTGGGPPPSTRFTSSEHEIQEMLGTQITGLSSEFDNDAEGDERPDNHYAISDDECNEELGNIAKSDKITANSQNDHIVIVVPPALSGENIGQKRQIHEDVCHNETKKHKNNFSASMLKQKTSPELQATPGTSCKKQNLNLLENKLSAWAVSKSELAEMQKKAFWEEHEEKLRHLKNINALEEKHKTEEHNLKMQLLKKEESLKLQILEEQLKKNNCS